MLWFTSFHPLNKGLSAFNFSRLLKIPLYSLCRQLNEEHERNDVIRSFLFLSLSPSLFPSLTAGFDLPRARHDLHTVT